MNTNLLVLQYLQCVSFGRFWITVDLSVLSFQMLSGSSAKNDNMHDKYFKNSCAEQMNDDDNRWWGN